MNIAELMPVIDGAALSKPLTMAADVVIVGSGPAGASVAKILAEAGVKVVVVEEGRLVQPSEFPEDSFSAMARLYRDLGSSMMIGKPPIVYLQGRAVGGSSVINGAISWRLPRDVYDQWLLDDPALEEALPWQELTTEFELLERELNVHATEPEIAGPNNLLMQRGAQALGSENRPINRNVRDCQGLGRCLQGCPIGAKQSMDRTYLPAAAAHGATIVSGVAIEQVIAERGRAIAVTGSNRNSVRCRFEARRAVVLAASAVQTPLLLLKSGFKDGPVGGNFQCHPGLCVTGKFAQPVRVWRGATQGHEVTEYRRDGIKFEALGYDMTVAAMRLPGFGFTLAREFGELARHAHWGVAVRARARGRIRTSRFGPIIRYSPLPEDMQLIRRGVRLLGELFFAAGAQSVSSGIFGASAPISDLESWRRLADALPQRPTAYTMVATHMFGSCAMSSDPAVSVVRHDFRHRRVDRLYIADSSVFPSNTGVNPQSTIIAIAKMCGKKLLRSL